jgi:putative ATPase
MERPFVLIGALEELNYLLELRGETDLKFDRIIGRNVLTIGDLRLTIAGLAQWLAEDGLICLVQTIPRHTQRLYELVDWTGQEELRAKVAAAEEAIYHDPADPLVNWDEKRVETAVVEAGLAVRMVAERQTEQRRITAEQLGRWFGAGGGRLSYGERLADSGLTGEEVEGVAAVYRRGLEGKVVGWNGRLVYVVAALEYLLGFFQLPLYVNRMGQGGPISILFENDRNHIPTV